MSVAFYTADSFIRRLGINLLGLMPLVSLTNIWAVISFKNLHIRGIDLLFVLLWLQYTLLYGKIRCGVPLFLGIIASFFSVSLVGAAYLPNYQVQWAPLLRFAQTLLWGGLALSFVTTNRDLKVITRNVIVAGSVLSLYSLYLRFTEYSLHRIAGFFSAAGGEGFSGQASFNEIGALYALSALLSLCYFSWGKKGFLQCERFVGITGLILNVIGLVLVQSRSGILAFAVGSLVFILSQLRKLLFYKKISRQLIHHVVIVCLSIVGIVIGSIYLAGVNRLALSFRPGSSEYASVLTRLALWKKGLAIWLADMPHFLVGYGFRSTERFLDAESAHNFFLNIGLWSGLIGLVFIIIILAWPLIRVIRVKANMVNAPRWVVIMAFITAFVVSLAGNVVVDPFYGGCTFLLLYGGLAIFHSNKSIKG